MSGRKSKIRITTRPEVWIIVILLYCIVIPSVLTAQDVTWITAEGTAPLKNTGKEEARKLALEDALHKAREKAVAANVSAQTLIVNLRLSGSILGAIPYGRVIEQTIIEEGVEDVHKGDGNKEGSQVYRVRIKARVAEETTGQDPDFRLEVSLNKSSFTEGEEMVITIKATRDCCLAVFNLFEDDKILRLIPNRFKRDVLLKAGQPFLFPDQNDIKKGITLKVHVPEGRETVRESFYVLALKQPFHLINNDQYQEGIFGLYNGKAALMSDLIGEIVDIPFSQRAEQLVSYQIRKSSRRMSN
ncbi:MAG: DUF4384 domain-containing protein [bacterium]